MINNKQAFMSGVWDYDFINECLPGRIAVSDIDGSLERKGNFLFIETKAEDASIPYGQYRLYEQLCYTGVGAVLFVYGDTDNPAYYQKMIMDKHGAVNLSNKKGTNRKHFAKLIRSWYDWANKNPTRYYENSKKYSNN
jgi:hypothetical protein